MNKMALKNDKMIPIKLPEICAPRLELLRTFDKASEKRCIYVNAPGGCGKTVSTLLWIQKSGLSPIWLSLDEYDNTPAAFYRFFCSALLTTFPQNDHLMTSLIDNAFNDSPIEYTIDILSRFSFDSSKYALVFDDFYFITNEEILKSLIYIIKRLPLSVSVVFLSRNDIPRYFAPLLESDKISCLTSHDLAFRSSEIRKFFSSYGRFVTEEEAKQAYELTDGWVIAVSALALSGKITAAHKLNLGLLDEYIEKHIWSKFDDSLQHFLIKTSIVDSFSEELCMRMTGRSDVRQTLTMLCSDNMFISRREDSYSYHHLFLDFLKRKADQTTNICYDTLYQTAADYFLDKAEYFDALRYYLKARDKKGTAIALYHFWNETGKSSSELSRIAFISLLPASLLEKNPYLYVGCAWYSLFYSRVDNFFYYLDKIYANIQVITEEYPLFLEGMLFLFTTDHRFTFTEQKARLPLEGSLALDAYKIPKSYCQHFPTYHRTHRDYSFYARNVEEYFKDFRLIFEPMLGPYYPIIETGVRAGILYEQNLLEESLAIIEPNPITDSDELVFLSQLHTASCLFALGREEEAAQCRKELKSFLEDKNLLYLLPVFSAYETNIRLMDNNQAAAAAWLDNYFVVESGDMELHKIYLHFTTARAYIALGDYKKAMDLCDRIKALSCDYGRLLDEIEATVLVIILKWLEGSKQEAVELLSATIMKAEPYHFVRVFADGGKALLPIINKLKKRSGNSADAPDFKYLHEIYQAAYEHSKKHRGMTLMPQKSIKLSRQQTTVLELLARGYRNAEIITMTGLSINTIRAHTKIIYQKLEVNSAADAIHRAKELGLIK